MVVLKGIIIIAAVVIVFVFGFFLMAGLDRFLDENRSSLKSEKEKREPDCVMLTNEMTDEEVLGELRRFREKHDGAKIILYNKKGQKTADNK